MQFLNVIKIWSIKNNTTHFIFTLFKAAADATFVPIVCSFPAYLNTADRSFLCPKKTHHLTALKSSQESINTELLFCTGSGCQKQIAFISTGKVIICYKSSLRLQKDGKQINTKAQSKVVLLCTFPSTYFNY